MKILVDLPDELYDTLQSKTLYLTSGARSNGKHLVRELIGCVLNGAVIKDIRIGDNVFRADDLTIVTGLSTDDDKPVPESKTWSNNEDKIADGTPVVTGTVTWNYDNETCKYCGNNPKNGGSGVCHCTLATYKIT